MIYTIFILTQKLAWKIQFQKIVYTYVFIIL